MFGERRSSLASSTVGLLVLTLVLTPHLGSVSAAGLAAGALAVTTDPAGASVFVDGALVGRTPLTLDDLAVGEHRVRISKPGYLDNSRLVEVTAGQPVSLDLRLTPDATAAATPATAAAAAAPGDSIFANKWFWVGVAGGGAAAAAFALRGSNAVPSVSSAGASPSTGLAGASSIVFTAQASDPDGDALSYNWDFGNGATSTAANPTHVYANPGTYTVRVTVSDGSGSSSAETTVTIRSLTGTWTASEFFNAVFTLTQNGTSVSGTYLDDDGPGTISGTVQPGAPRVVLTVTQPQFAPYSFFGDPNGDVSQIVGSIEGVVSLTLRRQ